MVTPCQEGTRSEKCWDSFFSRRPAQDGAFTSARDKEHFKDLSCAAEPNQQLSKGYSQNGIHSGRALHHTWQWGTESLSQRTSAGVCGNLRAQLRLPFDQSSFSPCRMRPKLGRLAALSPASAQTCPARLPPASRKTDPAPWEKHASGGI